MNWDPFQREVLAELGHVLYRTTTAGADLIAGDLPLAERPQPAASGADGAMLARLARAAGMPVEALPAAFREPAMLARLRGDGAAKRGLWPRLRALRAGPQ